jgi:hypothetical protein
MINTLPQSYRDRHRLYAVMGHDIRQEKLASNRSGAVDRLVA